MSGELTPQESKRRRKLAAQHLIVGGSLAGAGAGVHQYAKTKNNVTGLWDATKQVKRGGLRARHGKYLAGWAAGRAGLAAGVPLASVGAYNLARKKPETTTAVDLRRDVIDPAMYKPKPGTVHKMAPTDAAIKELPKTEQKQLIERKRKQTGFSLASAGLGATALGLKAPAGGRFIASKMKRPPKALRRIAAVAPKTDSMATNVGIGSLGVGSLGSLNFARIQRSETKADSKAAGIPVKKSQHNADLAKALVPRVPRFTVAPPKFGGVRPATMARIQTPTGMKTVLRRGSTGRSALS